MAATILQDFNGVNLIKGQAVKLLGVITDLNAFDNRYCEVTVTLTHPVAGVPDSIYAAGAEWIESAGGKKSIAVAPSMLVVGV